jgi:hypothetical protein
MESSADRPQIGPLDVDPEALRRPGAEFGALLADLGVATAVTMPAGTPAQGWRVLRDQPTTGLMLGAPVDERGAVWRIAQVQPGRARTGQAPVSVHPDSFPLRPSRAQRRRGLALRWPEVTRSEPDVDRLAIDIVNVGEDRWRPDGDSFHVIGFLQRPGGGEGTAYLGIVGGTDPAFPLDPGEYARVRVTIDVNQWRDVEPGRYQVHALLAELGVRAETPLEVELTEELIERHRPRTSRPGSLPDERAAMIEHLEMTRGLLAASERMGELMELISAASSDDDARQRIQGLLDCSTTAADAVYWASLRRFSPSQLRLLALQADELEQAIELAASGDGSLSDSDSEQIGDDIAPAAPPQPPVESR